MSTVFLKDATDVARGAYIQSTDPGVVGSKHIWINTTALPYAVHKRNDTNTAWDLLGYLAVLTTTKRVITANSTEVATDQVVFIQTSGGPVNFQLLPASGRVAPFTVVNVNETNTNDATILPNATAPDVFGAAAASSLVLHPGDRYTILPRTTTVWEII